eukprot:evm.model.scf_109.2 EVM.evm.TU.scf_109.2   scf_109:33241-35374(+)
MSVDNNSRAARWFASATELLASIMLPRSGTRLLMGSQGLWDLIHWEKAVQSLRRVPTKHAASRVIELAVVQNNLSIQQDTTAIAVDVLLPACSDFPKLARAKATWKRSEKPRGPLSGVRMCLGIEANKYHQAVARFRCDKPRVVAKVDGWEVWKSLQEPSISDSCSSHWAIVAAASGPGGPQGPGGRPGPRRQRWRAAGYSEKGCRRRGCGVAGGCACAPVSCFMERDGGRGGRTTASMLRRSISCGRRRSPRSPSGVDGSGPDATAQPSAGQAPASRRRGSLQRVSAIEERPSEEAAVQQHPQASTSILEVPPAGVSILAALGPGSPTGTWSGGGGSPWAGSAGLASPGPRPNGRARDWREDSARARPDDSVVHPAAKSMMREGNVMEGGGSSRCGLGKGGEDGGAGTEVSAWRKFSATIDGTQGLGLAPGRPASGIGPEDAAVLWYAVGGPQGGGAPAPRQVTTY